MWRWQRRLLVAVAVLFCATPVSVMVSDHVFDLVAVSRLPDGEVETRVRYGKMTAKETVAASKETNWETGFADRGVTLRELCAGHHLIQLIYAPSGRLLDCEYGKQVERSRTFLLDFEHNLRNLSNATVQSLEGRQLPIEYSWMNYTKLRSDCRLRHKELKEETWMRRIKVHGDRSKRDVSDLLLVPGTQWCGKGYAADKYTRLGGFSRTDKCCRKHDLSCPFWIGGFETKYGLFNWRLNTLMHCRCDERFRACLKRVGTSDANLVGKLFFNVVQTKCFVLKPKKKCHRSWWGKCEKYKIVKQAILRDNQPY